MANEREEFRVNRRELVGWVHGTILIRNAKAQVFAPDELKCEKAVKLLDEGQRVLLTNSQGVPMTFMKVVDGEYREFKLM